MLLTICSFIIRLLYRTNHNSLRTFPALFPFFPFPFVQHLSCNLPSPEPLSYPEIFRKKCPSFTFSIIYKKGYSAFDTRPTTVMAERFSPLS